MSTILSRITPPIAAREALVKAIPLKLLIATPVVAVAPNKPNAPAVVAITGARITPSAPPTTQKPKVFKKLFFLTILFLDVFMYAKFSKR